MIQAAANAALAGSDPGAGQPATAALDTAEAIRTVYASSPFQGSYIFAMILGITGMTGEYRYQTITPDLPRDAAPGPGRARQDGRAPAGRHRLRRRGVLVRAGRRRRGHRRRGYAARVRRRPALALDPARVLAVGLWTLLGIGIGTLIRNQVAAVLVAVFVTFLVEPLATFILAANDLDAIVKWLPTNASTALTSPGSTLRGRTCPGGPAASSCSATPPCSPASASASPSAATSPDPRVVRRFAVAPATQALTTRAAGDADGAEVGEPAAACSCRASLAVQRSTVRR